MHTVIQQAEQVTFFLGDSPAHSAYYSEGWRQTQSIFYSIHSLQDEYDKPVGPVLEYANIWHMHTHHVFVPCRLVITSVHPKKRKRKKNDPRIQGTVLKRIRVCVCVWVIVHVCYKTKATQANHKPLYEREKENESKRKRALGEKNYKEMRTKNSGQNRSGR